MPVLRLGGVVAQNANMLGKSGVWRKVWCGGGNNVSNLPCDPNSDVSDTNLKYEPTEVSSLVQ